MSKKSKNKNNNPQNPQTIPQKTSAPTQSSATGQKTDSIEPKITAQSLKDAVMQEAILLSTNKKSSIRDLVGYAETYQKLFS